MHNDIPFGGLRCSASNFTMKYIHHILSHQQIAPYDFLHVHSGVCECMLVTAHDATFNNPRRNLQNFAQVQLHKNVCALYYTTTRTHTHTQCHTYVYAHTQRVHTRISTHIRTHTYTYAHTHTHTHTHALAHADAHSTYTHTHVHIYIKGILSL